MTSKYPIVTLTPKFHPLVAWLANITIRVWVNGGWKTQSLLPEGVLYARGNTFLLENPRCIAIVGTREPTALGVKAGKILGGRIAQEGYTIISGMAPGCDQAGHEGALRTGNTIAVLGSSLLGKDIRDVEFAKRILKSGGVLISAYSQGKGNGERWKARNGIIAAIGGVSIPVQSSLKSGTINEINHAKSMSRPIWFPAPTTEEAYLPQYEAYWDYVKQKEEDADLQVEFFHTSKIEHIAMLIDTAEVKIKGIHEIIETYRSKILTEVLP